MSTEIVIVEPGSQELDPALVKQQMQMISGLMKSVLKENTHYGLIPGCGDKPALFQPGAQKLGAMFNLGPKYRITQTDIPGGHREYEIVCELYHRSTSRFIGEGVGACSTMEGRYRYRWDSTGRPVPKEYWEHRDSDLLGGPSFVPRKQKDKWLIFQRAEHDNPADYYNTAIKIAKKRAYNDAILTSTAASDIFVPDDDVPPEFLAPEGATEEPKPPVQKPQAKSGNGDKPATDKQRKMVFAKLKNAGIEMGDFEAEFGALDDLPFKQVNPALAWVEKKAEEVLNEPPY